MNGMNGVNAAAMGMLQNLLANPANLSLMMAQSPWMAQHLLAGAMPGGHGPSHHNGHLGPAAANGVPAVDSSALAAAAQFSQQLGAAGMGNIAGALNGLGLGPLQHAGAPQQGANGANGNHMQQHSPPGDAGWMPNAPPDNMVFYQNAAANGAMERTWGDHS
jgi:hypothetical protein